MEHLLQAEEAVGLALRDRGGGDARPVGDHGGHTGLRDGPLAGDVRRGGGLIQQVHGLVRQEAVADIALREAYGGPDRAVGNGQAVVHLQLGQQGVEHFLTGRGVRLGHVYGLEAAFQG